MSLTAEQRATAKRIINGITRSQRAKAIGQYLLNHPGKNLTVEIADSLNLDRFAVSKAMYYLRNLGLGIRSPTPRSKDHYYELTMLPTDNLSAAKKLQIDDFDRCGLRFVTKSIPPQPPVLLPNWGADHDATNR